MPRKRGGARKPRSTRHAAAPEGSELRTRKLEREKKLQAIDDRVGPTNILGKSRLTPEELARVKEVLAEAAGTHDRPSDDRVRAIVEDVVQRHTSVLLAKLEPRALELIDQILFQFALGLVGSATYDVLKPFLAQYWSYFMAAESTDAMTVARAHADRTLAKTPPAVREFVLTNPRVMFNYRAQVWGPLTDAINASGVESAPEPLALSILAHDIEVRLFGKPGV